MKILPHHPDDKPQLCHWLPDLPYCCCAISILNDILTIKKKNDDENNFKAWTFAKNPFASYSLSDVSPSARNPLPPPPGILFLLRQNPLPPPPPCRASKAERLQCFIQSVVCCCCLPGARQASGGVRSARRHSWRSVSLQSKVWLGPCVRGRMGGSTNCHTPVSPCSSQEQKPK